MTIFNIINRVSNEIFLKIIIFLIILTNLSLPVSASPDLPTSNLTNSILIDAKTTSDKIIIDYNINYTIGTDSESRHGIFLALPQNQDGIWTEYNLTKEPLKNNTPEKFSIIKESDSFRFRVGDPNIELESSQYNYQFQITANIDPNYKYNFSFIRGWLGEINQISGSLNGQDFCSENLCNGSQTQATINPDKQAINPSLKIWNSLKNYIIGGFISLFALAITWYTATREKITKLVMKNKPTFEPPKNLTPWEADYLIKDGQIDFKNSFLSYLLYLNHKEFIKLTPNTDKNSKDKIIIQSLKPLPANLVPLFMNQLVNDVINYGITDGVRVSKIKPNIDELRNHTYQLIKGLYTRKPVYYPIVISLVFVAISLFVWFVFVESTKQTLLIGNSIRNLGFLVLPIISFISYPIASNWSKLTTLGWSLKNDSTGWKYYLQNVEKFKLDFSNNPTEGVQYYLYTVPFAAQFGVLDKFNKYFNTLNFIETQTLDNTNLLNQSIISSSFYTPPSADSSGGGSGGDGGFSGGGGGW